eukprot:TRINITY_DN69996_c0_g1_i1.p1 TRINITY_DN69996_c0_g1~~TRINITY_DN69996_c0_g1_i1.p1  ORF type:complete len:475 (+),score=72.02 TRINITY_DN69996_c0_g1_i1:79-1503(+)
MEAKWRVRCEFCDLYAEPGDLVWPREREDCNGPVTGYRWSHFDCADKAGATASRPRCKHWARTGQCQFAEACVFRHDGIVVSEVGSRDTSGKSPVALQADKRVWGGRRKLVRKASRASVFRRFLLDEFGVEVLRSGCGVLDVAGGGGELGFELLNLNGVNATCIDPRPLNLDKAAMKWERGLYWWNPIWRPWNGEKPTAGACPSAPRHLRLLFDESLTQWAGAVASEGSCTSVRLAWLQRALEEARCLRWDRQGLHERVGEDFDERDSSPEPLVQCPPSFFPSYLRGLDFGGGKVEMLGVRTRSNGLAPGHKEDKIETEEKAIETVVHEEGQEEKDDEANEDEKEQAAKLAEAHHPRERSEAAHVFSTDESAEEADALELARLVRDCSAVVGMHPDQATGHIVEYAIRFGKAFAVVPCCVYASAFPKRQLADGSPVRSRDQLIQYLVGLHASVRTRKLDFDGQNVVVYWSPQWK